MRHCHVHCDPHVRVSRKRRSAPRSGQWFGFFVGLELAIGVGLAAMVELPSPALNSFGFWMNFGRGVGHFRKSAISFEIWLKLFR